MKLPLHNKHVDIGMTWAHFLAVYSQLGVVLSIYNTIMIFGVFYINIASHYVSLYLFFVIAVAGVGLWVLFILKVGISGYYRFLNDQSALTRIERRLDALTREVELVITEAKNRNNRSGDETSRPDRTDEATRRDSVVASRSDN